MGISLTHATRGYVVTTGGNLGMAGCTRHWLDRYENFDSLVLTPKIRGLTDAQHFDPVYNSMLTEIHFDTMTVTTEVPNDLIKGPSTLVFERRGSYLKIPLTHAHLVGPGYQDKVLWKWEFTGGIEEFLYFKEGPPLA